MIHVAGAFLFRRFSLRTLFKVYLRRFCKKLQF
jgi:hypothetical protein